MEIKLKIRTVIVVRGRGMDKISMTFDGPSLSTHDTHEAPSIEIATSAGFAEEWLNQAFGISPEFIEIVDVRKA